MPKQTEHCLCEGCNGSGIRAPATPSCSGIALPNPRWIVVERCDTCDQYKTDMDAAHAQYSNTCWVKCTNDGDHAIADTTSKRMKEISDV